jgi:methylmalonyl-CoA mutase
VATNSGNAGQFDSDLRISEHFPRRNYEDWEEEARRSLKGRPLESLTVETHEGIEIKPLYTTEDLPRPPLQMPGKAGRNWNTCCPVDLRKPEEAVIEAARGLAQGADSLWLKVDRRIGGWGRLNIGVLARLLEISGTAPIYLDGRGAAPALAAVLAAASQRTGAGSDFRGGFDFDPLGTLAADGVLKWSLESSFHLMADMVKWAAEHAPGLRVIGVSSIPYGNGGATAVDEVALALATGVEYLRRLEMTDLAPDAVARSLRLIMPVGRDLFMEIAKLRALRTLWSDVLAACKVSGDGCTPIVHAVTSPRCLTTRDPWVNMLRATNETFAAVVGGADDITVLPFDSAIGRSDAASKRLALNTSTILREEAHLGAVSDPASGSYFVERLTYDLASSAWKKFQHIETSGGMITYLRSGAVSRDLSDGFARRRRAVATRLDPITGVSSYPNLREEPLQRESGKRSARRSPDDEATAVHRMVGGERESFATAVEAAQEGLSVLELLEMLPDDGVAESIVSLTVGRDSRLFEDLRNISDQHLAATGSRPRVFLAGMESSKEVRSINAFASDILAAGGIAAVEGDGIESPEMAADALAACGSRSAIICATGERADEDVPLLASALKERGAQRVLVCAPPGDHQSAWRSAGVDGYVYRGCNTHAILADLLEVERMDHV